MNKLIELSKQKWFQLVAALAIGITIGVLFYPQSRIEERTREELKIEYSLKEEELQKQHLKTVSELTEKINISEASRKEYEEEYSSKVEKLTQENSTLKQSVKKQKFKLVKPDGTIIEKELEESNTEATTMIITQVKEEFSRKVKEIEDKWKKIHEERIAKLKTEYDEELIKVKNEQKVVEKITEKEKITEINAKKFRPEVGVTTNKDVYMHATYNLWGPVFVGGGVSGTDKSFGDVRVGAGLEF